MGVMDKFLSFMQLSPEDDNGYYDGYDEEDEPEAEEEIKPKKHVSPSVATPITNSPSQSSYESSSDSRIRKETPKVTPINKARRATTPGGMEVCVIRPSSFEDSREITETLLMNRTVVLNLEGLDMDIAQRIIDFTSGSCFAMNGNLQKISNYIFIITPQSVDISGDFQDMISGSFEVPNFNN